MISKSNKCHGMICQIKHDIRSGCLVHVKKLIPFILLILIFCIYLHVKCREEMKEGCVNGDPTIPDYLLFIFRGMWRYIPENDPVFEIPVTWLMVQLMIAFAIGNYAYEDLGGYGQQFLIRSGRKSNWYFGKCVYCLITVLMYYGAAYFTILLYSAFAGSWSFSLSPDIGRLMSEIEVSFITKEGFFIHVILLPVLTSLVISLVQMFMSLFIRPNLSFAIVMTYHVLSAYWMSPIMIGNYSMILRFDPYVMEGLDSKTALIIEGIMLVVMLFAGRLFLRKYDYIERE